MCFISTIEYAILCNRSQTIFYLYLVRGTQKVPRGTKMCRGKIWIALLIYRRKLCQSWRTFWCSVTKFCVRWATNPPLVGVPWLVSLGLASACSGHRLIFSRKAVCWPFRPVAWALLTRVLIFLKSSLIMCASFRTYPFWKRPLAIRWRLVA